MRHRHRLSIFTLSACFRIVFGIAILSGEAFALSKALPPLPPVNWQKHVDPRFDPPVERIVVESKAPLRASDLLGYWQSWDPGALDVLRTMMDASRWRGYEATIVGLFYACPLEAERETLQAELVRRAEAAAVAEPALAGPTASSTFDDHLWAATALCPDLLLALLQHDIDWIRFKAAIALVGREKVIAPAVRPVLQHFLTSDNIQHRRYALSLSREAPSDANDARAAQLEEKIAAMEAHRAAKIKTRLRASNEPAHIRGVVTDKHNRPQHGLLVSMRFTDFLTGGDAGSAEVATGPDGGFELFVNTPGIATIYQVRIPRIYEIGRNSGRPKENCRLLEPVPRFDVFPGSTIDELDLTIDVPEPSVISGTVTDESGTPLEPSVRLLVESTVSNDSSHYVQTEGTFIFYALPNAPFAIEFTLPGHQARILQAGRDFAIGDRDIAIVLPTSPYPEDLPVWTTVTGTPWTQEAVDASVQGTLIRRRLDSLAKIQQARAPEAGTSRVKVDFGDVRVRQLFE